VRAGGGMSRLSRPAAAPEEAVLAAPARDAVVARREGGCPVPARLVDVPRAERQALAPEAAWHMLSAEEVLRAGGQTRGTA
jgi:hypothetical protein